MKTKNFKLLNEEIRSSKRIGIEHLSKLKPLEFLNLIKYFQDDLKGIISSEKVKINIKIDGCGIRFGIDSNQDFFIESSNSGPQFKQNAFSDFTKNKFGSSNEISDSYDDVFGELKSYKPLQSYLKNNFPNGIKIFAELLYTPLAKEIGDQLQFLVIKYDKKNLGNKFSLILYKVEDVNGKGLKNEKQIFEDLKKFSNNDIVIDDQTISYEDINISYEINSLLKILEDYDNLEQILTSRKSIDKKTKDIVISLIQQVQNNISDKIINTKFNHRFSGKEIEGLVLYFSNDKIVKVTSDIYNKGKEEFNKNYREKKK